MNARGPWNDHAAFQPDQLQLSAVRDRERSMSGANEGERGIALECRCSLSPSAYTVHVGTPFTSARFKLSEQGELQPLLRELLQEADVRR